MKNIMLVFLGGGVGSALRYLFSTFFTPAANSFPYATLLVNVSGSFIIGILMGIFMKETAINENWRLLLITGYCGGFTTFSAFSKESFMMMHQHQYGMLTLYISISIIVCIAATATGFFIAK